MSVRTDIIADLHRALQLMRSGAGYHYDWGPIYRWRAPELPPSFPAGALLDLGETIEQMNYPVHERRLSVEVHGVHSVEYALDEDPGDAGNRMIEDIERACMGDCTRGGLAVDTRIVRNEKFVDYPSEPLTLVVVIVEITYRTLLTDPQTAV